MTQILMKLKFFYFCVAILLLSSCNNADKKDKQNDESTSLIELQENNKTVSDFVNFVNDDKNRMSLDHSYTYEGLMKLAAATNAIADEISFDLQNDLADVIC